MRRALSRRWVAACPGSSRNQARRGLSQQSTSFGFAGLEHEFSVVSHTPVFSHIVSRLFLSQRQHQTDGRPLQILDMTFGAGGHSEVILNHQLSDLVGRLVVCDCDRVSHSEAKELRGRNSKVVPLKARFAQLPNLLLDNGFHPGTFDGILIDVAGCSPHQWADPSRGFCPNKPGSLDLRYDPDVSSVRPTASEVLQSITDRDLTRLIKSYSGLSGSNARYAANAIVEARYMFHKFKTTQELYEVMRTAARTYQVENQSKVRPEGSSSSIGSSRRGWSEMSESEMSESQLSKRLMREVLTALQLFVNDGANELHFAINSVARHFLRPAASDGTGGGTLIAIVNTEAERKVAESCLTEADDQKVEALRSTGKISSDTTMTTSDKPCLTWRMVHESPQEMTAAEKTLYPRLEHSKLYSATLNV